LDPRTRSRIRDVGVSVWLRADLDVLVRRTGRHGGRPLLKNGDPRAILAKLMEERYPIYAEADITVDSTDGPHEVVVRDIMQALEEVR
jgi:shikimate kinase